MLFESEVSFNEKERGKGCCKTLKYYRDILSEIIDADGQLAIINRLGNY